MIQSPFNILPVTGQELEYIKDAIDSRSLSGDGKYTRPCHDWLEQCTGTKKALLTTSCTHALVESESLIRLPLYFDLSAVESICSKIKTFFLHHTSQKL